GKAGARVSSRWRAWRGNRPWRRRSRQRACLALRACRTLRRRRWALESRFFCRGGILAMAASLSGGRDQAYPSFQQGGPPWNNCAKRQKWNSVAEAQLEPQWVLVPPPPRKRAAVPDVQATRVPQPRPQPHLGVDDRVARGVLDERHPRPEGLRLLAVQDSPADQLRHRRQPQRPGAGQAVAGPQ